LGFGPDDITTIQTSAAVLAPLVPALVDAVFNKLHRYDATWRNQFRRRKRGDSWY